MALDSTLVSRLYDPVMYLPERKFLPEHREYLVRDLSGRVLDLGAGTGALFPYLAAVADTEPLDIHAIEPDDGMRERAKRRLEGLDISITVSDAGAESLPYPDNSFDAAIASLVFCTIPDDETALDEIARVLKPGGEFRFLEHVRGSGAVGRVHDTAAPLWFHVAGGCNLNRHTGEQFQTDERFTTIEYERFESGLTRAIPLVRGRMKRNPPSLRERIGLS